MALPQELAVEERDGVGVKDGRDEAVPMEADGESVPAALAVVMEGVDIVLGERRVVGEMEAEPERDRVIALLGDSELVPHSDAGAEPVNEPEAHPDTELERETVPDTLGLREAVVQREGTNDAVTAAVEVPPSRE